MRYGNATVRMIFPGSPDNAAETRDIGRKLGDPPGLPEAYPHSTATARGRAPRGLYAGRGGAAHLREFGEIAADDLIRCAVPGETAILHQSTRWQRFSTIAML